MCKSLAINEQSVVKFHWFVEFFCFRSWFLQIIWFNFDLVLKIVYRFSWNQIDTIKYHHEYCEVIWTEISSHFKTRYIWAELILIVLLFVYLMLFRPDDSWANASNFIRILCSIVIRLRTRVKEKREWERENSSDFRAYSQIALRKTSLQIDSSFLPSHSQFFNPRVKFNNGINNLKNSCTHGHKTQNIRTQIYFYAGKPFRFTGEKGGKGIERTLVFQKIFCSKMLLVLEFSHRNVR